MGGVADVYQTKKRGRHFYTRCDCCGLNQGTGSGRQQKIFDEATFTAVDFVTPSNVDANKAVVSEQPEPMKKTQIPNQSASDDFNPNEQISEEPSQEVTQAPSERKGLKIGLALLAMGASVGAGIWMS